MKTGFLAFLLVFCSLGVFAQTVVSSNTDFKASANTQITFNNNLVVNSTNADLRNATLALSGTDQTLTNGTSGAIVLGGLIVGQSGGQNGGTKGIEGGSWEIMGPMIFNDGVVVPQTSSNGKIAYTKPVGNAGDITVNNSGSYVNGTFYSKGAGTRFFPIGNNSGYFPSQLFSVGQSDIEIGMRVLESNAALNHGTELLDVFEDRYWELIDASSSLAGPTVAVSTFQASSFIDPTIATVLVASSATSGDAVSLGGAASGDYIVGATGITMNDRVFTLAKISSDQVEVKIHNVVTPFLDNANDYLQIENIGIFPDNKVMLLDRWGVKVKEWSGYANVTGDLEPDYDLSNIATGNYICIVEYKDGSNVKKLSQMVTIINQ